MTKTADKIIVALDVATQKQALGLVETLRSDISFFKIGLQLYTAAGPEIVREVIATGADVFLDLKLHDIPNTVAGAVAAAGQLGVKMLTVHLSGGQEMIKASVAARTSGLAILGVTVLTSADEKTLRETGIAGGVGDQVLRLAQLGATAGVDGLVASPHEVKMLRQKFGSEIMLIVPGIRPSWTPAGDQKRVMAPREAMDAGADYLVIGRPITAHPDPREAVAKILEELNS
jgi:orotidine-5'-phosphate decarboxylase